MHPPPALNTALFTSVNDVVIFEAGATHVTASGFSHPSRPVLHALDRQSGRRPGVRLVTVTIERCVLLDRKGPQSDPVPHHLLDTRWTVLKPEECSGCDRRGGKGSEEDWEQAYIGTLQVRRDVHGDDSVSV